MDTLVTNEAYMKIPDFSDLVLCIKDEKGKVLEQNEACGDLCGNEIGNICTKNCMQYFKDESGTEKLKSGFHFFEKRKVNNENFDIMILKKPGYLISYLHPTKEEPVNLEELMEHAQLTKREQEVLKLRVSAGLTLKQICEKLFISRATLRTHINNINKKIAPTKT